MRRALRAAGYSVGVVCGVAPQEILPVKGVVERSDVFYWRHFSISLVSCLRRLRFRLASFFTRPIGALQRQFMARTLARTKNGVNNYLTLANYF